MKIKLQHVHYMPKELRPGILYVSKEFCTAAHLCACGCGSKVRTPLRQTEWSLEETDSGPTLRPSVGNWQLACRAHYWIYRGEIKWASNWTPLEVASGRRAEEKRRYAYYETLDRQHGGLAKRFWVWVKRLFNW